MDNSKRRSPCVEFTKAMKKTHTILIPSMLDFHFPLLIHAFLSGGYKAEVLKNNGEDIISCGWEYSNNDVCFPANLIIGQFITALKSGIVAVPFGCLVSHSCARGVINKIRRHYPDAVVSAIDFDSGLAKINQLNRIEMILNFT